MAVDVNSIKDCVNTVSFWRWFFSVHLIVAFAYSLIFYVVYSKADHKGESARNCRNMATCSISTVHSVLCTIGVIFGFFHDELYKIEYRIVSPPGFMY